MRSLLCISLFALLSGSFVYAMLSPDDYLVDTSSLPGMQFTMSNFSMYSGYIQLNETDKHLFFWFFTQQSSSGSSDVPVILWMNGGPGASSLYGALKENGPLRVDDNLEVHLNPYSWNQEAHVLYLEAPVGVGFSYSTDQTDYMDQGDDKTASDNYEFLLQWFQVFSDYASNPFYITGESYGGHYCPQLASKVIDGNQNGYPYINLKGMMVGNAWSDEFWDGTWSPPRFAYGRGLVSQFTYENLMTSCEGMFSTNNTACEQAMLQWKKEQGNDGIASRGFNQLMLYEPCYPNAVLPPSESGLLARHPIGCINCTAITQWLNNADTMSAIHAVLNYGVWGAETTLDYTGSDSSVLELYPNIIDNIQVMLYSGDCTTNVNFMGTDQWIKELQLPVTSNWTQWFYEDSINYYGKQVAGWTIGYQGIRFTTVTGAGHMVPQYRPAPALTMLQNFLSGEF